MNNFVITWTRLKSLQTSSKLPMIFVDVSSGYQVFIYDVYREAVYLCNLSKDGGSEVSDFETNYKPALTPYLSVEDGMAQQFFDSKSDRTASGLPMTVHTKSDDTRVTLITHDWTDKTSWYEGSVYAEDEVVTDSGDQTTYNLSHASVIDTHHGTLTDEDYLKDSSARSYRVAVKVNDVVKTEQDPHTGSGGDFTMNYDLGKVIFLAALDPADVVKVTYHYAASSIFTVKPPAGKILTLGLVEVQFSTDITALDSVIFQPYGYVQSFAPQYTPNPYPANTLIPLGNPSVFKGIRDFLNSSVRSYPIYQAVGGGGWRGMAQNVVVFDWDYTSNTLIDSSKGMELRVSLQHNTAWSGAFATATFYCTSKSV